MQNWMREKKIPKQNEMEWRQQNGKNKSNRFNRRRKKYTWDAAPSTSTVNCLKWFLNNRRRWCVILFASHSIYTIPFINFIQTIFRIKISYSLSSSTFQLRLLKLWKKNLHKYNTIMCLRWDDLRWDLKRVEDGNRIVTQLCCIKIALWWYLHCKRSVLSTLL